MKKIITFLKSLFSDWGLDKWAHLCIGGLACALLTLAFTIAEFGHASWRMLLGFFVGLVPVLIFSVFKELIDDTGFDWKDIAAAVIGCLLVLLAVVFGIVMGLLNV